MPKAILVIDMPESCDMCDFEDIYGVDAECMYCNVPGCGKDVTDYIACRPDFCPLRELPEKKIADEKSALSPLTKGHLNEFEKGWNDCLDAIVI